MTNKIIRSVGIIELVIGISTFISISTFSLMSISEKPINIFTFVFISSIISIIIGAGLLTHKNWARNLIVFFSGYVILTKILIYSGILHFSGEILAFIPTDIKDFTSILYHSFIIYFFSRRHIRNIFVGEK